MIDMIKVNVVSNVKALPSMIKTIDISIGTKEINDNIW